MKLFKKLVALIAAGALAAAFAVTASAESTLAKLSTNLTSGKSVTDTVGSSGNDYKYYQIKAANAGELKISMTIDAEYAAVALMDSETNVLSPNSFNCENGSGVVLEQGSFGGQWSESSKKLAVSASFEVKKGTYYVLLSRSAEYPQGSGKYTLTVTAPQPQISYLSLTLPKGSKVVLGTVISGTSSSSVKWTSSKKTVATVTDKGVLSCVKKGTALITAKLGSSTTKIKIIIT